MKRINLLGVNIDNISMGETVSRIESAIITKHPLQHVVVNAGKYVMMQKDPALYASVAESDLINADGQSIVWASRFLGTPLPERIAGIDLMVNLIELAHIKGYRCFFLGAREEVVSKVASIYSAKYSPAIVAGYRSGYFTREEEPEVAKQIAKSDADLLFVAITSPKKEIFLNKYKDLIKVPFIMGVGGSFDVVAGITKRAPLWMQKMGMEWFYRLAQEPGRMWKRYLVGNSMFIYLVLKQRLGLYKNPFAQ